MGGTVSGAGDFVQQNPGALLSLAGNLAPLAGATPLAAPLNTLGGAVNMYQQPGQAKAYQDAVKAQKAVTDYQANYKPGESEEAAPTPLTSEQEALLAKGAPKSEADIASSTLQSNQPLIAAWQARRQQQRQQGGTPQGIQVGGGMGGGGGTAGISPNAMQQIVQALSSRQTNPFGGFGPQT